MFALNIGIVVVRKAEKPTISGLCVLIASMNFSGADVVHVPLDGAHHHRADRLRARLGQQRAEDLQRPGHRLARDQHLRYEEVAALEPGADLLEGRDQRLVEQRLRAKALPEALIRQVEHRRAVPGERLVVQFAEQLVFGHAVTPCPLHAWPVSWRYPVAAWAGSPARTTGRQPLRRSGGQR
jgi:hypothetical protein